MKIRLIKAINLGRYLERQVRSARDCHGTVDALLRRNASQEGKVISTRIWDGFEQVQRETVLDGGVEVCIRDGGALGIRNRY